MAKPIDDDGEDGDDDLDARIQDYAERAGMQFRPWQIHPADATAEVCPLPEGTAGAESWPQARRLRRRIVAALKAEAPK